MKPTTLRLLIGAAFLLLALSHVAEAASWKAGVARLNITPAEPMWMGGYGSRDRPSEGTLDDLWVKALAVQAPDGKRAVIVTSDLLGFPRQVAERICGQLRREHGLNRDEILLNSSHTHSGPVLQQSLYNAYPIGPGEIARVEKYTAWLEAKIVGLVGEALAALQPASLWSGSGHVRFAVNRRKNREADLPLLTELAGPVDHSVPVLKVTDAQGTLKAVLFGYACHATTLNEYEWSGDYAGFAQIELERLHPGVSALFLTGCGGDQNPIPRRTVALARQYGRELAAAVDRVLEESMAELEAAIQTSYSQIPLTFSTLPGRDELNERLSAESAYERRWAASMLKELDQTGKLPADYPYPIQVWKLGDQSLVALGGEVVVEYAINIKRLLGQETIVAGYSNDVMAYIPSLRILREGGYEGDTSMLVYGLPAPWAPDVEQRILSEVLRLAGQLK